MGADEYLCDACRARYPVVFGIPDFRVEPDPWIGLEDDRDKAARLLLVTEGLDLAASVRAYWDMTPGTPAAYAQRFTSYVRVANNVRRSGSTRSARTALSRVRGWRLGASLNTVQLTVIPQE